MVIFLLFSKVFKYTLKILDEMKFHTLFNKNEITMKSVSILLIYSILEKKISFSVIYNNIYIIYYI